ncbi:MAG: hypothetical protein QOI82_993 [Actinomycetota bacterium]|nr:hypothetical protein [Actinomycetota bacterium]
MTSSTGERQNAALDALIDLQRADAMSFAAQCRALVELDALSEQEEKVTGGPQHLVMEVAGSCRLGQQAATSRLLDADRLVNGMPLLLGALEAGRVFVPQARILLGETGSCSLEILQRVDAVVTPQAEELASSDLRRLVRRTVLSLETADEAADRLETAREMRGVRTRPGYDGMGVVNALLTAEQLVHFQAGMDQLVAAQRVADREAGVERSQDHRRADVFAALPSMVLSGGFDTSASLRPPDKFVFNVHIPVSTVLDRGSEPGMVDGYGEISAEHVRLLRPHASLRPIYVDAQTGQPIQVGDTLIPPVGEPTGDAEADLASARERVLALLRPVVQRDAIEEQHDPSAALSRLVDARDRWCAGVGCSSTRCDRDHLVAYPEGPTAVGNLGLKSRRCHGAKHNGWTMVRHPDGSVIWTSPLGRTYRRPSPHVPPPAVLPPESDPEPHDESGCGPTIPTRCQNPRPRFSRRCRRLPTCLTNPRSDDAARTLTSSCRHATTHAAESQPLAFPG